jgi:hypothetical protein
MAQLVRPKYWWQAVDRRTFGKGALAFTALLGMSGCQGEEDVNAESLALQRQHGWNMGAEDSRLFFVGISEQDATGATTWKQYTDPNRLMETWRRVFHAPVDDRYGCICRHRPHVCFPALRAPTGIFLEEEHGTVGTTKALVAGRGSPHLWQGSPGVYGTARYEWL